MTSTTSTDPTRRAARLEHSTMAWHVIEGRGDTCC